jgi:hypothetical protein
MVAPPTSKGIKGTFVYKDIKLWEPVYENINERIKEHADHSWMPFLLCLAMDYAEWCCSGLQEVDRGLESLEQTLVNFSKATEGYPPSPMQKVVIRYLQRKLIEWGRPRGRTRLEHFHPSALKDRLLYASLYIVPKKREDSDEEDLKELDGWNPPPKANAVLDFLDCFIAGEQDAWNFRASDPLALFFKLRYACILNCLENHSDKAVERLDKMVEVTEQAKLREPGDHTDVDSILKICAVRRQEFASAPRSKASARE